LSEVSGRKGFPSPCQGKESARDTRTGSREYLVQRIFFKEAKGGRTTPTKTKEGRSKRAAQVMGDGTALLVASCKKAREKKVGHTDEFSPRYAWRDQKKKNSKEK